MDAVEAYRHAARVTDNPRVKRALIIHASMRADLVGDLVQVLVTRFPDPNHPGLLRGVVHSGWLRAVSAIAPNDNVALLRECARGESETVTAFIEAFGHPFDAETRAILQVHLGRVFEAMARVKGLERELAPRSAA